MDLRIGESGKVPEFGPEYGKIESVRPSIELTPPHKIQMHPGRADLSNVKELSTIGLYGENLLEKAKFYFD